MLSVRSALIAILANLATCLPPAEYFDAAVASTYECTGLCQSSLKSAVSADNATFFPAPVTDATFFDTAANFTCSRPGDLLKLQPIQNLASYDASTSLPGGTSFYVIQYASVGLDNKTVPATAFIALPFTLANSPDSSQSKERFPLVSFAHGTTGVLPNCAATLSNNFYDYYTWTPLVLAGFAVVATDYHGLGNNHTRHPFITPTVNSNDVYYAAKAAQAAFPTLLTSRWGVAGHSEGGGAAYAITENELIRNDKDFVGAAALAPVSRIYDELNFGGFGVRDSNPPPAQAVMGYLLMHTWSLQTAFPDVNVSSFLSPTYAARFTLLQKLNLCFNAAGSLTADHKTLDELFSSDGGREKWFSLLQKFQKTYGAGQGRPAYAPLLIVQSEGDASVPYKASVASYNASCKAGNEVELALIPLVDHSATVPATAGIWVSWLKQRILDPRPKPKKRCSTYNYAAVDASTAFSPEG